MLTRRLRFVLLVLAVACLPGEPTTTIEFILPAETPLAIAINTTTTPDIVITADGEELPTADYRLESLDGAVVSVTTDGTGLIGLVRDTTVIRVVFRDASGEVDSTFAVVGVASTVQVTSPTDTLVKFGETVDLTAEAFDANDDGIAVTSFAWSSSDESVATVDTTGTVTAVGEGTADIHAMVDAVSGSAPIAMRLVVTDVAITTQPFTMHALTWTRGLDVLAFGVDQGVIQGLDNSDFTWRSSNAAIASVDSSGIVTARRNGTAFVSAALGGEIDSLVVTVDQIPIAVLVNPDNPTLARTDTTTFSTTIVDSAAQRIPNPTVTWTSSNDAVATVSGGLVSALTLGAATITAEANGVSGTASLNIVDPQSLTLSPSTESIDAWLDTTRLVVTVRDGSNRVISPVTITWTTNDAAIATVANDGSDGLVTGRGNGTATITATAPLGVTNTATISVNQLPVSSIIVSPLGLDVSTTEGPKGPLMATALDGSGSTIAGIATWRSLNPYRATIDSLSGMVTAHASGQVTMAADIAGVTGYALVTVAAPDAAPVQSWALVSDLGTPVFRIWGLSPTKIWAANASGIWMYDGSSWTLQLADNQCCSAFWGASETDVWAVAATGRDPTRLFHWDGTAWSPDPSFPPDIGELDHAWGSSPIDAWISGTVIASGSNSAALYHYDGVAWTFEVSLTTELNGIWGSAADNIWAVGRRGETGVGNEADGPLEVFLFNGTRWQRNAELGTRTWRTQLVWGNSSEDVWAIKTGGSSPPQDLPLVSRWQGSTWSPLITLPQPGGLYDAFGLWGSSASEMYAAVRQQASPDSLWIYHSDGGGGWDSTVVSGFFPSDMWGTSDGPVWIAGTSANGGLLRGARQ